MIADTASAASRPLDEQRAIADFLDRETARIDTLIEEQQRLIEHAARNARGDHATDHVRRARCRRNWTALRRVHRTVAADCASWLGVVDATYRDGSVHAHSDRSTTKADTLRPTPNVEIDRRALASTAAMLVIDELERRHDEADGCL